MEPRPQRPRSTTGGMHPPASQPGGSPPIQPTQHQDRGDIGGAFIAPPRTEYDYSPLDLAPPAQRRKRQLVGGVIVALGVLAIGAIAVFGYLLFRDDTPSDNGLAPTQTAIAQIQATSSAAVAMNQGAEGTPAAVDSTATVPATQPAGAPTSAVTTAPTSASASAGPSESELKAMLPAAEALPVTGLDVVEDSSLTKAAVAEALGGSRTAEQNLETWGWSGNATRSYSAADPTVLDPGATTNVVVSVHGFNSPESAQEALTFFSDVLANSGYEEIDAPELGDKVRLLRTTNEDGSMNVALYVTKGNVLYRIGGSAMAGGNPTDSVLQVADAIFNADAGQ